MEREDQQKTSDKNKHKFSQKKSDGLDVEFSEELADNNDKQAMARSKAADNRARK
ncbi:YfhD family protein [Bacillus sp. FSL K6-3431]|uniref:YfhD family protein n=1 Tax=Bacillus sp. FSL K6-3431 TaxID=2921500 RepID=UPI0030FCB03C